MQKHKVNKPYTNKEYADLAVYCNHNNCHIEDKGDYLESVQNEYVEPTYAEKRAEEYPSIQEQLDMIYWDNVNGTTKWVDKIAEIKAKYPKGE